ncbi:MAG TPA: dihydropyrimidinase [Anaerolineae bacterium]|nr:dihydropyrimidinase [Anaerolineae bacterium]
MDLVLKGGTVATAIDIYRADVGIKGGSIAMIGRDLRGDRVLDVSGKYVFPGAVDPHTHLELEFMDTVSSDDFYTGTVAAACGGTTTIIDYAEQMPGGTLGQAVEAWRARADSKVVVDYGLHVSITDVRREILAEMEDVVRQGVSSFKCYLAYPERLRDDELLQVFFRVRDIGALVNVHCENGWLVDFMASKLLEEGKTAPRWHPRSRPPAFEEEATERAAIVARVAQAPLYVVHLTCTGALEAAKRAREAGQLVFVETCPQYLVLDVTRYDQPGFEGAKYVMSPPLRERAHLDVLWRALAAGDVDSIGTDHCPFYFVGQKDRGRDDFTEIPNGMPTVETRVPLLFHEGVNAGRITLHRFVELVSTQPARLFGLFPQKGTVAVGSDADLVVWDPNKEMILTVDNLHMNVDYSPYEHVTVRGYPEMVLARGKVIVEDNRFVGEQGSGRFLERRLFTLS